MKLEQGFRYALYVNNGLLISSKSTSESLYPSGNYDGDGGKGGGQRMMMMMMMMKMMNTP